MGKPTIELRSTDVIEPPRTGAASSTALRRPTTARSSASRQWACRAPMPRAAPRGIAACRAVSHLAARPGPGDAGRLDVAPRPDQVGAAMRHVRSPPARVNGPPSSRSSLEQPRARGLIKSVVAFLKPSAMAFVAKTPVAKVARVRRRCEAVSPEAQAATGGHGGWCPRTRPCGRAPSEVAGRPGRVRQPAQAKRQREKPEGGPKRSPARVRNS